MKTCELFCLSTRTSEQSVEHYLNARGHHVMFTLKFHCKLNPIEWVWGRVHPNKLQLFTCASTLTLSILDFVPCPEGTLLGDRVRTPYTIHFLLIRKYFWRVSEYERAYIEGKKAGKELEQAVKVFKSHRRIF